MVTVIIEVRTIDDLKFQMIRIFFNLPESINIPKVEKSLVFSVYIYLYLSNYNGGAHLFFILFNQDENWVIKIILVHNFINLI